MRGKDAVNLPWTKISEFYSKWRELCQKLFSLFDWLLKKVLNISFVKKSTVWQLKVELESLHKLKFYPSVLLLMIKMSQSAREKLDSCKISLCYYYWSFLFCFYSVILHFWIFFPLIFISQVLDYILIDFLLVTWLRFNPCIQLGKNYSQFVLFWIIETIVRVNRAEVTPAK